jgi:hypothetical protein
MVYMNSPVMLENTRVMFEKGGLKKSSLSGHCAKMLIRYFNATNTAGNCGLRLRRFSLGERHDDITLIVAKCRGN